MKFYAFIVLALLAPFIYAQEDSTLNTYTKKQLLEDYDLMISSLKEGHAGLYWYTSPAEFDSITTGEGVKLKDGMNSYDFFKIASKIVSATKEGHSGVGSSKDIHEYFTTKALFLPVLIKMLDGKPYMLNDIESHQTKGNILTKINDESLDDIIDTLFSYTTNADGYIKTGKTRYGIDYARLAYYYADYFKNEQVYDLKFLNHDTGKTSYIRAKALSFKDFNTLERQVQSPSSKRPIELHIDEQKSIAQLALNSFRHTNFDKDGDETIAYRIFTAKIDSVFAAIQKANIKNLIIDIRRNGGGTEGYEDYVVSHLTEKSYSKYNYVQANALSFSFLPNTQYNTPEKEQQFNEAMKKEFYLEKDGRYLRKENFMEVAAPKKNPFKGRVLVLISGRTYSGGSEFAALLKEHTEATFIGEETGGGYYGQTSGFTLTLYLPNTHIRIKIPLLKFVVNVTDKSIPMGRGVIPEHTIEPTYKEFDERVDVEMNFAFKLITKGKLAP